MTLAAALEPARRAEPDPAGRSAQGAARPALGAARPAALAGRRLRRSSRSSGLIVGAARRRRAIVQALVVYAVLLVGTLLIPFILPAVARLAGLPFAARRSGSRSAWPGAPVVRDPSRTALTLGGLTSAWR